MGLFHIRQRIHLAPAQPFNEAGAHRGGLGDGIDGGQIPSAQSRALPVKRVMPIDSALTRRSSFSVRGNSRRPCPALRMITFMD